MSSLLPPHPPQSPSKTRRDPTPRPPRRFARGSDLVVPVLEPEDVNLEVGDSTELIPRKRWAKRKRSLGLPIGAVAAFAAAAAITFVIPAGEMAPANVAGLDAEAEAIASTIDATARAAHLRADGIAASPMLRAAILTDAATVADMIDSEYRPTLGPGETFELVQHSGETETVLLRMPENATAIAAMGDRTTRLDVDRDGRPVMVVTSPVTPYRERAVRTKISGSVVLAIPLDLRLSRQRLGERAAAAALTGGSDPITLVRGSTAADATAALAMPLPVSDEWKLARMDLRVVPKQIWKSGAAWRDPTRYAACGMGTALLLVFGLRTRKNRV